ncbi:MAG: PCMD domain-containing protein [Bacteroidales bacterium]|nr:PCMD domain-containing protein [Bacteroidales bacterium]
MEIPIEYRSLTRKPTHIIVICAASIRGDYLTGSSRTTLWVDDFDLIY